MCKSLELLWGMVAERRVEPSTIVELLDNVREVDNDVLDRGVLARIDLFALERFDQAFHRGVVVGIAAAGHRAADAMLGQPLTILPGRVLAPPVGVVYEPGRRVREVGTAAQLDVNPVPFSIVERNGYQAALDAERSRALAFASAGDVVDE